RAIPPVERLRANPHRGGVRVRRVNYWDQLREIRWHNSATPPGSKSSAQYVIRGCRCARPPANRYDPYRGQHTSSWTENPGTKPVSVTTAGFSWISPFV